MAREKRRLAAILAADVVGYSRLMGLNEAGTLACLKRHRAERLEPALARHGGRLVKLTGDGALVEFASAVDALGAAIEFQQSMADANRQEPAETAMIFRVGLHLGDLIADGDDLYGDGVNIAARLEAEAPSGGVAVSRTVREAVEGRLSAEFEDLGERLLKNIERPVQVFRVTWRAVDWTIEAGPPVASPAGAAPSADIPLTLPDKPSIAVLPFQNMSGDPEQEYFVDGLVEDIITALSRFKSLFVIARNSSFTFKGKAVDIKQVGEALGVRYVLEGSVRKAGGKLRITGQLIDSETGAHLWADRFDGALEDIFELQDEVTARVVGAIAPRLDRAELERSKRNPVENLAAYDCFLHGLAQHYLLTRDAFDEALRLFYQAIQLDPDFVTPYGFACRIFAGRKTQNWSIDEAGEKAEVRRLAEHVLKAGHDDAGALCGAGHALAYVGRDYDTGVSMVDRGLALNPNLAMGWALRGFLSTHLGQHEAAVEQITRGLRLNPMDPSAPVSHTAIAQAFLFQGKYDEAVAWAGKALAQQSNRRAALQIVAAAQALQGRTEAAQSAVKRILDLEPAATVSSFGRQFPFQRRQDLESYLSGLRLAGLPE